MKTTELQTCWAEQIRSQFRKSAALALKLAALPVLVCLLGCQENKKEVAGPAPKVDGEKITIPADAPQKTAIAVEEANQPKDLVTHLTGRLIWNDDLTVRVFSPVAGRVETVLGTLSQSITAGQPLAKIASPDFGQAQADARKAAGDLQLAERALTRVRELQEHGAAPKKDVDSAEADYTRALSEKERAAARLTLYGGDNDTIDQMYVLKSPLAGVIVEKNINPGQEVRPDQMLANAPQLFAPLFVISNPDKLWLQLDVTEVQSPLLSPGQPLRVSSPALPGKIFEGKLLTIGNSLDPTTRTVRVAAEVDNHERLLKAEMFVNVDAVKPAANDTKAVTVSSNAVFLKDNRHYVFVEDEPGQYERKLVTLGAESDGKILVTEGIAAGQKVVTEGCLLLQALLD